MRGSLASWLHRANAFVRREHIFGALEVPADKAVADRALSISGWAFSPGRRITQIKAVLGTLTLSPPEHGLDRPDVAAVFKQWHEAVHCGFQLRAYIDPSVSGPQLLTVTVIDDSRHVRHFQRTVVITPRRRFRSRSDRRPTASPYPSVGAADLPSVSIVIPVHGGMAHTDACLRQLQATIPQHAELEIIVVDDGSLDESADALARWCGREPRLIVLANDGNRGFVESCNRGAAAAHHDVLVFLNNDTLTQADWLPPLVMPLRTSTVGAVGAKLLYPDGSLQEAGCVVFNDGSAWNFGKGSEDPDEPLFSCVREVDYCSAAVLATRRTDFMGCGGFDTRFAPAYYEDTDYCFSLRSQGLKVVYQPASVVVHIEGATAGNDETAGAKRSQLVNRAKFAEKWRGDLADRPAPPAAADRAALFRLAAPATRRRALIIAPTLPEWDRESGSKRMFDLLTFLRDSQWHVSFVAECADAGESYISTLQQMGIALYAGSDSVQRAIDDPTELITLGGFDIALLHFWWIAERHIPLIRRLSPSTRIVVDSVDLHFLRQSRNPRSANGGTAEKSRELAAYASADTVLTVSELEARVLTEAALRPVRTRVVRDAEPLSPAAVSFAGRRGMLFLGNFRHPPNVDALEYLMRAIVPRLPASLLERHPLTVVGTDLTDAVIDRCGARRHGVDLVGWVPSVYPFVERTRLMVAPLTYGAGTKRKLIQSAMAGTPAVTTGVGVEGLPLLDGEHVIVADDAGAFADAVARVIDDAAEWQKLSDGSRQAIRAVHDPEIVRRQFCEVLETLGS